MVRVIYIGRKGGYCAANPNLSVSASLLTALDVDLLEGIPAMNRFTYPLLERTARGRGAGDSLSRQQTERATESRQARERDRDSMSKIYLHYDGERGPGHTFIWRHRGLPFTGRSLGQALEGFVESYSKKHGHGAYDEGGCCGGIDYVGGGVHGVC